MKCILKIIKKGIERHFNNEDKEEFWKPPTNQSTVFSPHMQILLFMNLFLQCKIKKEKCIESNLERVGKTVKKFREEVFGMLIKKYTHNLERH